MTKGEKMFRSLKTKFAKIALSFLVMQLALIGVAAGPNGVNASVSQDSVDPIINSLTFAGKTATKVGNIFTTDISESADFSIGSVDVSEESELFVDGLSNGIALLSGVNNLTVADLVGGPVTLSDLQSVSKSGVLALNAVLVDPSDNDTNYTFVFGTADIIDPVISSVSFGGVNAVNEANNWKFNTTGLDDSSLAALKVGLTVSEESYLVFPVFSTGINLNKGYQELALSDIVGYDVTNQILKDIAVSGGVVIDAGLIDASDNLSAYQFSFSLDTTAPKVVVSSKPVVVTDVKKSLEIYFSADEAIELSKVTLTQNNGGIDNVLISDMVATKVDNKNFKLTVDGNQFMVGLKPIFVTGYAKDAALNKTDFNFEIKVDTIAPLAVTGLTATIAESGAVTLNWVNPTDNTDVDYLAVYRDGVFYSTLPAASTTFADSGSEKGKTYYYEVILVDKAGNKTITPRIDVSVPAPVVVAAAVSDTIAYSAPVVAEEKAEVKADTDEGKQEQKGEKESKDGFPTWGIILLLILLGIGGYLYWAQRPAPIASVAPKTKPIATGKSKKKKK